METKRCFVCKKRKPLEQFNRKATTTDGLQGKCKSCSSDMSKEHYRRNRGDYIARNKRYRQEFLDRINEYKSGKPCADCGGSFHFCAMDFDHLDPTKKVAPIARLRVLGSWTRVLDEIEKCELVCANCHRVRSYNRSRVI